MSKQHQTDTILRDVLSRLDQSEARHAASEARLADAEEALRLRTDRLTLVEASGQYF